MEEGIRARPRVKVRLATGTWDWNLKTANLRLELEDWLVEDITRRWGWRILIKTKARIDPKPDTIWPPNRSNICIFGGSGGVSNRLQTGPNLTTKSSQHLHFRGPGGVPGGVPRGSGRSWVAQGRPRGPRGRPGGVLGPLWAVLGSSYPIGIVNYFPTHFFSGNYCRRCLKWNIASCKRDCRCCSS